MRLINIGLLLINGLRIQRDVAECRLYVQRDIMWHA